VNLIAIQALEKITLKVEELQKEVLKINELEKGKCRTKNITPAGKK